MNKKIVCMMLALVLLMTSDVCARGSAMQASDMTQITPLILFNEYGEKFIFDNARVTIGRAEECDIVLSYNEHASPTHAVFSHDEEGWTIADADSVNGTWLNNKKLEPYTPHVLHDTDVIIIPNTEGAFSPYEPATDQKAPDGTVILSESDILWSDKFVFFNSLLEKKQSDTGRSFLKYDQDGNLYSDIPSPEFMLEHEYKQCNYCGAVAEKGEDICQSCGQSLPSESLGYADPVSYTEDYKDAAAEIDIIIDRMFPDYGLGWVFRIWHLEQAILRERYHILWRTPNEMNPHIIFE